jgi:succinate dehydrogenase/fumarate reductase flavoprotein subunit
MADEFDRGVTRRGFVAGVASSALIGAAATACGSEDEGPGWDREVDVVVVGAGTGLVGALAAAAHGAQVLVLEKRVAPGGSTAMSGGVVWVPNNHAMRAEGIEDSRAAVITYLRQLALGQADEELIEAFADSAPRMARFVEDNTELRWRVSRIMGGVADYHPEWPGSVLRGRSIEPAIENEGHYGGDLVNGLLEGVRAKGGEVLLEAPVQRLVTRERDDGAREVIGVEAQHAGKTLRVRARRGVQLAAGGFDWDFDMKQHFLRGPALYPLGANGNTGDGVRMAMAVGADLRNMNEVWAIAAYRAEADEMRPSGGGPSLMGEMEKRYPASIVVNRYGERFHNEAGDYDSAWRSFYTWENHGLLEYRNIPAFTIFDSTVRESLTIAGRKSSTSLPEWVRQADSLATLARRLKIDPSGLEATVARFNASARQGRDPAFHRGESAYDRQGGDDVKVTLAPLEKPPFFGVELVPADLGTCGGPRVNRNAQVLDPFGAVIPRLYASGNNAGIGSPGASYGGGGGTIGPALTFSFLAGSHLATLDDWS